MEFYYLAGPWKKHGLDSLIHDLEKSGFQKVNNRVMVNFRFNFTGDTSTGFIHTVEYKIFPDGCMRVTNQVKPYGNLPILPRIGVRMSMDPEYNQVHWLGRGPYENYPDRKSGSLIGLYEKTVEEFFVPYVRPQETGNREDTRWVALTNKSGNGLLVVADRLLSFSALHYTSGDLEAADHLWELIPRDEIIFCIDHKQLGLGNGSCGPGVLNEYLVYPEECEFVYQLRPRISSKRDIREFTRMDLPE